MTDVQRATAAVADGELVVYPTETVYGLAADALDAAAVERVFEAKGRDPENPVSLAVPDVDNAFAYTSPTERERTFMREFLPGPVTVVVERDATVPDELTAGRDRVGIRVPDNEVARDLAVAAGPITSTSANVSGEPSARHVADLDSEIRAAAAVVLDDGQTPGTESTVVDVEAGEVIREGTLAEEIRQWLKRE